MGGLELTWKLVFDRSITFRMGDMLIRYYIYMRRNSNKFFTHVDMCVNISPLSFDSLLLCFLFFFCNRDKEKRKRVKLAERCEEKLGMKK